MAHHTHMHPCSAEITTFRTSFCAVCNVQGKVVALGNASWRMSRLKELYVQDVHVLMLQ